MSGLFLIAIIIASMLDLRLGDDKINFQRVYRSNEYIYEQNPQANFQVRYPGQVKGIYNYGISQEDFEKKDGQTTDNICSLVTDTATQTADNQVHITLAELINNNSNPQITAFADCNFINDKILYLLTDHKDVLQVKLAKQFTLMGTLSIKDIYTDALTQSNSILMIALKKKSIIYIVANKFIASKQLNKDEDFAKKPFVIESGFKSCSQVLDVIEAQDFIVISCLNGGLNIYKLDSNQSLVYVKTYEKQKSIYQASYSEEQKYLAFLDDSGIRFLELVDGDFGDIKSVSINFQNGRSFSQYNMQTFWIKSLGEFQINEIFVDINEQTQENNGTRPSNKELVGTYLNDIYGIIFNQNSYMVYIHSIPNSILSELRDKIATYPLEDTEDFIVIEDPLNEGLTSILSITQKSLKLNTLQFVAPQFKCNPREDTGKFVYKLRIYSKECDRLSTKQLFYQCLIEDTMIIKMNKAYVTSSDQNLAIGLGVGLTIFFLIIIVILYILYRRKKLELNQMEDKARDLRQQKYIQLQQEKGSNISANEA